MRILKIVIIAIVLSPTLLLAGEFETKKETRDFADKFTSQLLREEFKAAFDAAKQYWPVPAIEIDGMVNQIYQ